MVKIKKVGLALGSGGARGFAHVGVIKILQKNNIPIDYISGTSMGAIIAAYFALYGDMTGIENVANTFRKRDYLRLVDLNNPKQSLIKGHKVKKLLKKFFGNKTFEDTKIPLTIAATDLNKATQVIIKKGRILDALMASGAFPGVFPVIKYKGKYVVDGGLLDATPVNLVSKMGAEIIIAVDLFYLSPVKSKEYTRLLQVVQRVYDILLSNLSKYSAKEYGDNIIVITPDAGYRTATFAFHKARVYMKTGEIETQKNLNKIKRLLK